MKAKLTHCDCHLFAKLCKHTLTFDASCGHWLQRRRYNSHETRQFGSLSLSHLPTLYMQALMQRICCTLLARAVSRLSAYKLQALISGGGFSQAASSLAKSAHPWPLHSACCALEANKLLKLKGTLSRTNRQTDAPT